VRATSHRMLLFRVSCFPLALLLSATVGTAQNAPAHAAGDDSSSSATGAASDLHVLADAVRDLQGQVQTLTRQLSEMKSEQERARADERELRSQLDLTRAQLHSSVQVPGYPGAPSRPGATTGPLSSQYPPAGAPAAQPSQDLGDRVARLEENQQFTDEKLNVQDQTKVESGSKYRLRLSGIVLLNMFANRGNVDNLDVPQLAAEQGLLDSRGTFGGTLRQSQIGLEAFGPDILGAHTSANVQFDFAGGFPDAQNGAMMGLVRLRTGTVRFDWADTSIIAGQDTLFFSPLAPTSIATLAVPALAYAGNLWSWTPQIRVEHRIALSENSSILIQGGILDSWTGDVPPEQFYRYPTWGEESAQPAYAMRTAWNQKLFGRQFTIGASGYYARQYWGLGRRVDGWAGTTDLSLPLGKFFTFSGEFYRGRAVAGLGGAIGQDVIVPGSFISPATPILGLDSLGGWAQLKFKPAAKFEVNGAYGQDNPFARELRRSLANAYGYDSPLARNRSPFVNFIYQPRSDVMFSTEYRRIRTFEPEGDSYTANQISLTVGYVF
jgi:hypothetical protein